MKRIGSVLACLGLLGTAQAAQDFACMQQCIGQGYERNYCMSICATGPGAGSGGMMQQPGLPKNPAFEQVQPNPPKSPRQALPRVADPGCMKDCQKRGYNYMLCQKQCSWSLNDY